MARRNSEVELCFDSMSDLITNLAGGLILVVLLLLGLTHEAPKTREPTSSGDAQPDAAEKSTRTLVARLNDLQIDTARMDDEITEDQKQFQILEKRVDDLLTRIAEAKKKLPDSK